MLYQVEHAALRSYVRPLYRYQHDVAQWSRVHTPKQFRPIKPESTYNAKVLLVRSHRSQLRSVIRLNRRFVALAEHSVLVVCIRASGLPTAYGNKKRAQQRRFEARRWKEDQNRQKNASQGV